MSRDDSFDVPVDELLRLLYSSRVDWLVIDRKGRRVALHKERLISFMGMGMGSASIDEVLKGKKVRLDENIPEGEPALFLDREGARVGKNSDSDSSDRELPVWWDIPLPIFKVDDGGTKLNEKAVELFDEISLTTKERKSLKKKGDMLLAKGAERIYLSRLDEGYYLAEDVSGDISIAEDIGWWAAVGRALADKLRREGRELIRRDRMSEAEDGNELLPCRWENDLLGYVEIRGDGTVRSASTGDDEPL